MFFCFADKKMCLGILWSALIMFLVFFKCTHNMPAFSCWTVDVVWHTSVSFSSIWHYTPELHISCSCTFSCYPLNTGLLSILFFYYSIYDISFLTSSALCTNPFYLDCYFNLFCPRIVLIYSDSKINTLK